MICKYENDVYVCNIAQVQELPWSQHRNSREGTGRQHTCVSEIQYLQVYLRVIFIAVRLPDQFEIYGHETH